MLHFLRQRHFKCHTRRSEEWILQMLSLIYHIVIISLLTMPLYSIQPSRELGWLRDPFVRSIELSHHSCFVAFHLKVPLTIVLSNIIIILLYRCECDPNVMWFSKLSLSNLSNLKEITVCELCIDVQRHYMKTLLIQMIYIKGKGFSWEKILLFLKMCRKRKNEKEIKWDPCAVAHHHSLSVHPPIPLSLFRFSTPPLQLLKSLSFVSTFPLSPCHHPVSLRSSVGQFIAPWRFAPVLQLWAKVSTQNNKEDDGEEGKRKSWRKIYLP